MVPPTESLHFVAGELGKCGRNLEEIGAKFLGPNRFKVFLKTLLNAFLQVHDLGHIGKLEANLSSFIACKGQRGRGRLDRVDNGTQGHWPACYVRLITRVSRRNA